MEILVIITKVLSRNSSNEEKEKLMGWLKQNEKNISIFKQTESIWYALEIINSNEEFNADHAFNQFENKINAKRLK